MGWPVRVASMLGAVLATALLPGPAAAHPHIWVAASIEVRFADGRPAALRVQWQFDPIYSAFAIQQFDDDRDGRLGPAELRTLAEESRVALRDYGYFTHVNFAGEALAIPDVAEVAGEVIDETLHLGFTVPLPERDGAEITLSIHDPTYYIALSLEADEPLRADGGWPAGCEASVSRDPGEVRLFAAAATELVRIGCRAG